MKQGRSNDIFVLLPYFGILRKVFKKRKKCIITCGNIPLSPNGVSFPGRYGHGNPTKPVNTALSALHRFQSYIISVCF